MKRVVGRDRSVQKLISSLENHNQIVYLMWLSLIRIRKYDSGNLMWFKISPHLN